MPLIHERTFRIRHYECDAYGHVNHANYLRYMQETAFDASAAAGYDMARYAELSLMWLIRETNVTYERPLRYGDSITVKTWIHDFRRVRSRRMYEIRHADSGDLVASAHTDWVLLDTTSQRPTTIPPTFMDAFFPEGAPPPAANSEKFPEPPAPPAGVFTLRRTVEWRDLDSVGHVNNANYLSYLEECGIHVASAYGWPMSRMIAHGFGTVARQYRIEYRQQAVLGDELDISTWVSDPKRTSAVRHYTVHRATDGELLVRARALWVWVDLENGRPIRIPATFLADFAPNITG
ncbi:MAG: acyl-CoA thioesterase [Chloroflexota bacterium]